MGPVSVDYFITLFDEFKAVNPAKIEAYLDIATGRIPQSVWGKNTRYATALLTAHILSTSGPQGGGSAGGAVSSESVGELSRSFAQVFEPGSGDAVLSTTRYGIDFIALRKETIVPPMSTIRARPRPTGSGVCW